MKNNKKFEIEYTPEDIRDAFMWELRDYEDPDDAEKMEELDRAISWIRAAAENEYNDNMWRTLYRTLEGLRRDIEDNMPWWDKE